MTAKRNLFVLLIASIIVSFILLFGCSKSQNEEKKTVEKTSDQPEKTESGNERKGMSKEAAEFFKKADDF